MGWFKKKNKKVESKVNNEDKSLVDDLSKQNAILGIFSRKRRRIATAFVFERVGRTEIFMGSYPLLKGTIKELGQYVILDYNGRDIFLNVPHYNDFVSSKNQKIGKVLEVVKFAEDDFRVRSRLNEEYSAVKDLPQMKTKEVCQVCDMIWDKCTCSNKDEENKIVVKIQEVDKLGKPLFKKETVKWEEPKGVTQEGRDSIRAMNNYQKRMEEHRKKNEGFWAKYGALITFIIAMVFSTGICGYSIYKVNQNLKLTVQEVHYAVDNAKWWENQNIVNNIAEKIVTQEQIQKNISSTPPI